LTASLKGDDIEDGTVDTRRLGDLAV